MPHTGKPAKAKAKAKVKRDLLEIHMHLDVDRDGRVDDNFKRNNKWNRKRGAVILCNNDNDDDDVAKEIDWENQRVDTAADASDIAPLQIRIKRPTGTVPAGWKAFLEVDDWTKIRIFDKPGAGGVEKIGPKTASRYELPDLSLSKVELGMEAVQYPGPDWKADPTIDPDASDIFDGMVKLTLELVDDKGKVVHRETARVRVAPWVLFCHFDPTDKVYMVQTGDNARFRTDLKAVGLPGVVEHAHSDRWMQDIMELGYSSHPGTGARSTWSLPVVLRTAYDRSLWWGDLDTYPKNHMLKPGFGFTQALLPTAGNSLDSFGNLECSPPVKKYRLGRVLYGGNVRSMQDEVVELLKAQKVQSPFAIDTDWLAVGHVDEIVSFCPMKNAPRGFKVLLASPLRALAILEELKRTGHGTAKLFDGIQLEAGYTSVRLAASYPHRTVNDVLNTAFIKVQKTTQRKIDKAKRVIRSKLGLKDTDFIDLPVLFHETSTAGQYVAYTAGVVNMLVVTSTYGGPATLCIPKPFGPVVGGKCQFEKDIEASLGPDLEMAKKSVVTMTKLGLAGVEEGTAQVAAMMAQAELATAEMEVAAADAQVVAAKTAQERASASARAKKARAELKVKTRAASAAKRKAAKAKAAREKAKKEHERTVKAIDPGLTLKFIDDFCTYHVKKGEIHCGTNSLRRPRSDLFWWEVG